MLPTGPLARAGVLSAAVALVVACLPPHRQAGASPAGEDAPSKSGPAPGEAEAVRSIDAKADEVIRRMTEFYAGIRSFAVDVATYRVVTRGEKSKDAIVLQTVAMRRPNGFSLVQTGSDGQLTIKSDGSAVTTYLPEIGQYIVTPAPGTFGDVARETSQQPMRLALEQLSVLGALVLDDPYGFLMAEVGKASYVALEKLDGGQYHHVVLSREDTDWNMWIASGRMPLLKMIIPDLSRALAAATRETPGLAGMKLDVTMLFENWSVNADLPDSQFAFEPPAGSRRVERFNLDEAPNRLLGKAAPPLVLPLLGGGRFDVASHRGSAVVVLEFWASWCRPCRERLPVVAGVAGRFADRGVVLCLVNQGEDAEAVRAFLKELGLDVTVATDDESEAARACCVTSIPQTLVIGRDGVVAAVHAGQSADLAQTLDRELEALVGVAKPAR